MDTALPDFLVCFAHGKESGPWGTKITRLAEVARARGFEVMSPDYSGTHDPHRRVEQLLELRPRARRGLVLVGSSMGGYVSAMATGDLAPQALFLMAPALYFPGFDAEPPAPPAFTTVVHGWDDDIVPLAQAQRYAKTHRARLHVLDSGHTLNDRLPILSFLFAEMLDRVKTDAVYRFAEFVVGEGDEAIAFVPASVDAGMGERVAQKIGAKARWALVTAHNPGPVLHSDAENAARHEALCKAVADLGIRSVPALGRDVEPPFGSEISLVLVDAPTGAAEELGRRFEQNAIVSWRNGERLKVEWLV